LNKKKPYRFLRILGRILLALLLIIVALVLFIRSPWGQDIIVNKVTKYVSDKTGTTVEIDRLFLTFSGNIYLEGLYLEDQDNDTLVYSRELEANLPISPIVFNNEVNLKSLQWSGLKARVERLENSEAFNFSFLIDAFAPTDTVTTPQAGTEPMTFDLGSVDFNDFDLQYEDDFLGIDTKLLLGRLFVDANTIDLDEMRFELDDLELSDVQGHYLQTKPFEETQDTTETQLPFLAVDQLKIANVQLQYISEPDNTKFDADIQEFLLELPKADLANNEFEVDLVSLYKSKILAEILTPVGAVNDSINSSNTEEFKWPEFLVEVEKIDLQDNQIVYSGAPDTLAQQQFDPQNLSLSGFDLNVENISYRPAQISLSLNQLAFKEGSGLEIRNTRFKSNLDDKGLDLSNLSLSTANSSLSGKITVQYDEFESLMAQPDNSELEVNLDQVEIGLSDLYYFQPSLKENEYLNKASELPIRGRLQAVGTLANVDVADFMLNWGENTSLSAQGNLKRITEPDSLSFNFDKISLSTKRKDLQRLVNEDSLGVALPTQIDLDAKASGKVDDIVAHADLRMPEGRIQLDGNYKNSKSIGFKGDLKVETLQLDKLLKNEQLGAVSFAMKAEGSGNDLNSLNASLNSDFTQLMIKGYDFSNLKLDGQMSDGLGTVAMKFKDDNLNFDSTTKIQLDSVNTKVETNLDVIGADLYALGVTRENIKAGVKLKADYSGTPENYKVNALLSEGIAVYENDQYQMGDFQINAAIGETDTDVSIESEFLNGIVKSNSSPDAVIGSIKKQFEGYFTSTVDNDTINRNVKLDVNLALSPVPILTKVFLKGVERLDSVNIRANYDAFSKNLKAGVHLPTIVYNGNSLDSLEVSVNGSATDLNFSAGFAGLLAGPINIKKTFLNGNLNNRELLLDFNSYDDQERLMHMASELVLQKDTISVHINPSELIFNKKDWSVPQENKVTIAENYLGLQNVKFSRNSQELTLSNAISDIEKEHLGILFNNFRLQTFLSLLNPDEALASGQVAGELIIENPFEAPGLIANFKVNGLELMQNALGNLSLNASSKGQGDYDFDLALKDGGVDLNLVGDYAAAETGARLNLDLDLNKIDMAVVEGLSEGALKESKGYITGSIQVNGTTVEPKYNGNLTFNETEFNIADFNSLFKVNNETLKIDETGLFFDSFEIKDANNGQFVLDGDITTEEFTNPGFDLSLKAEEFRVLNSTKEDNELYYGTASIDADLTVKGDLELPQIDGKLRVRNVTDVTYVVAEEQLDVEERDGVVIFVNKDNPDAILTRQDQEETPALFQGFDLSAILEIADDAVFHIIIDERTGDNLQVSGDAELSLNMSPNGRINLTGRYELNSGHYETSLYNLVNRRFTIKPGGSITWRGDPTDAALDVTAIYEVETSAAPLMAAVTSGQDVSVTGKYQQVLPFLVYLNVEGELLQPQLSFDLDMPEDEQGSLGGAVYGRVQQLNEQEAALNKQVFSLLALNRFFPDTGSDGSAGGTVALARDNVNKVLSGQLNAFSDKVFGKSGFEVDFDLDSFTDYQGDSPQDRTQLNINAKKKLFDDRLVVTAGSAVDVEGSSQATQGQTPLIGNVSLEYLLTEDGRYRLKGYRKNEYENVIDGQLIVTGLALIFNREFNRFSQLFNPLKEDANTEEAKSEE